METITMYEIIITFTAKKDNLEKEYTVKFQSTGMTPERDLKDLLKKNNGLTDIDFKEVIYTRLDVSKWNTMTKIELKK